MAELSSGAAHMAPCTTPKFSTHCADSSPHHCHNKSLDIHNVYAANETLHNKSTTAAVFRTTPLHLHRVRRSPHNLIAENQHTFSCRKNLFIVILVLCTLHRTPEVQHFPGLHSHYHRSIFSLSKNTSAFNTSSQFPLNLIPNPATPPLRFYSYAFHLFGTLQRRPPTPACGGDNIGSNGWRRHHQPQLCANLQLRLCYRPPLHQLGLNKTIAQVPYTHTHTTAVDNALQLVPTTQNPHTSSYTTQSTTPQLSSYTSHHTQPRLLTSLRYSQRCLPTVCSTISSQLADFRTHFLQFRGYSGPGPPHYTSTNISLPYTITSLTAPNLNVPLATQPSAGVPVNHWPLRITLTTVNNTFSHSTNTQAPQNTSQLAPNPLTFHTSPYPQAQFPFLTHPDAISYLPASLTRSFPHTHRNSSPHISHTPTSLAAPHRLLCILHDIIHSTYHTTHIHTARQTAGTDTVNGSTQHHRPHSTNQHPIPHSYTVMQTVGTDTTNGITHSHRILHRHTPNRPADVHITNVTAYIPTLTPISFPISLFNTTTFTQNHPLDTHISTNSYTPTTLLHTVTACALHRFSDNYRPPKLQTPVARRHIQSPPHQYLPLNTQVLPLHVLNKKTIPLMDTTPSASTFDHPSAYPSRQSDPDKHYTRPDINNTCTFSFFTPLIPLSLVYKHD